jgi:hypothetical protein
MFSSDMPTNVEQLLSV